MEDWDGCFSSLTISNKAARHKIVMSVTETN